MSAPQNYAYGQSAPPPVRRSGMATAGKWMFIIGLILSLLAAGAMVWGLVQIVQAGEALEQDTIEVQGEATVPMEAATMRFIMATTSEDPTCTVTSPSGTEVPVVADDTLNDLAGDPTNRIVGTMSAESAGDYTVACTGAPATVSGALGTGSLASAAAFGLGALALIPLGLLTLVGLILWLVGRSRNKRAARAGNDPYGYSTSSGSGYAAPQDYGQQPHQQGYGQVPPQGYGQQQGYGASSTDPYAAPPPPPGYDSGSAGGSDDAPGPGPSGGRAG